MTLRFNLFLIIFSISLCIACGNTEKEKSEESQKTEQKTSEINPDGPEADSLIYPQEKHFKRMVQLTDGGDNAEAYWSSDQNTFVFQSNNPDWGVKCDQIFAHRLANGFAMKKRAPRMISTGKGRTTCSYFMPGDTTMLYASTHLGGDDCPPEPKRDGGKYVWPIYNTFDIFVADPFGKIIKQLTDHDGYDAEATVSPKGDLIVFTSDRSGDLELYTMDLEGNNVKQVTTGLGYDGGAFFSPDGTKLVFRSSRPQTEEEIKEYKDLLAQGLVQPTNMEIYVCNVDGSDLRQVTNLGKANWAPFYHPSGEKILFSSNHSSDRGYQFNLYMINVDGSGLEQVSYDKTFDAFPMFSPDGNYLLFSSNRNNGGTRATNIFLAEWQD